MREHGAFIICVLLLIAVVIGTVLTNGILIFIIMLAGCAFLVLWMIWDMTHLYKFGGKS
jgi:hypothetical protein